MSLFKVDRNKCIKCGACSETCPVFVISFSKEDGPKPAKFAEKACISCGQCVSVCPKDALSHMAMSPEECRIIKDELKISKDQAEQFLMSRRSIRVYQDKKVSKNVLENVIETARYAPTGHNFQNVKWKVIADKNDVVKLKNSVVEWLDYLVKENSPMAQTINARSLVLGCKRGYDLILRDAPHVIVAYGKKEDRLAQISCTIALSHLELAAKAAGLGTCWAGFLDLALSAWPPSEVILDLPDDCASFGSMMIGYPKYTYKRIPKRKKPEILWH